MSKEFAKLMYEKGLANDEDLKILVNKKYITEQDFLDIIKK